LLLNTHTMIHNLSLGNFLF